MPKLLVLDLKGALFHNGRPRPYCKQFLAYCYRNFDVAFFSSAHRETGEALLNTVLTPDQRVKTVFTWFRDRTRPDPEPVNSYDTIKLLSDVFNDQDVNYRQKYHEGNTIICDDSSRKVRFNHSQNVLLVEEWTGNSKDEVLKRVGYNLMDKFKHLKQLY